VFASSGDDGAAQPSCDGTTYIKSAGYPASDPLVTGVGATSLTASTSAGSPQWAAIAALADQSAHHRLGFLNPALYLLSHGPKASYVFHDVTTGNNSVTLADANGNPVSITGYSAGQGWDAVTGIGTPDVAHLLQFLH
jgi:subtilase family serine protease